MNFKITVDSVLRQTSGPAFTLQYWDGESIDYGRGEPRFALRVRARQSPGALCEICWSACPSPTWTADIELRGNLLDLIELCHRSDGISPSRPLRSRIEGLLVD